MATKDKGKKRILENQLMFEFFGELETEIKPRTTKKKQAEVKAEIEKQKKSKAIKRNHIKKNRKIKRSSNEG